MATFVRNSPNLSADRLGGQGDHLFPRDEYSLWKAAGIHTVISLSLAG